MAAPVDAPVLQVSGAQQRRGRSERPTLTELRVASGQRCRRQRAELRLLAALAAVPGTMTGVVVLVTDGSYEAVGLAERRQRFRDRWATLMRLIAA